MRGTEKRFSDLPGWTFVVDEISVGVYRVRGSNVAGMIIEQTGNDPEILLANCKLSAENADFEDKYVASDNVPTRGEK